MTIWILVLLTVNIFLGLAVGVLWVRMTRPPKEDPRLSRGLQLLQSKIAILEDLSDRTDVQVRQLVSILDERAKGLQSKLLKAEEMLMKIEGSMVKSLDVAKIFQDKIPHEEIIERHQTSKYVLAAKLAHEGKTVQEIVAQVELPESEVEFIAKVNRDELAFDPNLLPEWAKLAETQAPDLSGLQAVEDNFKQAVREYENYERQEAARVAAFDATAERFRDSAVNMAERFAHHAGEAAHHASQVASQAAAATAKVATQAAAATVVGAQKAATAAAPLANSAARVATQAANATAHAATQAASATAHAATATMSAAKSVASKAEPVIRKVQFPRINIDKNS